jgi:phospholipid/cholesterol/gamma-HCH transport system substrate-binding protein
METRAPFVLIGAFVLAAACAMFGFVFWLNNVGGLGKRATYQVRFEGSVSGLLVGAGVLFNGIRVGEVVGLGLAADHPRRVDVTIAVAETTPVRNDTRVGLDFQGLTGVPVISLEGGAAGAPAGAVGVLVADAAATQSMTQAARDALRRVDSILAENSDALRGAIANLGTFAEGLAKNTPRLDGILAGVERMTGSGAPAVRKTTFDLRPADAFAQPRKALSGQLVIAEPTAVVLFETQRFLVAPDRPAPELADAQWSDSLPKMLLAKLLQSFENYDPAHPPLRADDAASADLQLLVDLRSFHVTGESGPTADIAFSAKLLDKERRVVAARLFTASRKLDGNDPSAAFAAFNEAFGLVAADLIGWTVEASAR